MNTKNFGVRMDQQTGDIWLTQEKYAQPVKRLKNITNDVILALAAEIVAVNGTKEATREVRFSDGGAIRLTITDLTKEERVEIELDALSCPEGDRGSATQPEE